MNERGNTSLSFFCHLHCFRVGYFCNKRKTETAMIKENKIFEVVETLKTFSLEWVSKEGELVKVDECTLTSFHSDGKTMNVRLANSGQFRKVNRKTVTKINGQEVFL